MLVRRRERKRMINCTVIPGEACVKQHRIVVMDIKRRKTKELGKRINSRIKNQKGEEARECKEKVTGRRAQVEEVKEG